MNENNSRYPYLGYRENEEGKKIVVMFTSPDEGVVLVAEYEEGEYKMGYNDTISEAEFAYVPQGSVFRIEQ